jgi:hypothetical protein
MNDRLGTTRCCQSAAASNVHPESTRALPVVERVEIDEMNVATPIGCSAQLSGEAPSRHQQSVQVSRRTASNLRRNRVKAVQLANPNPRQSRLDFTDHGNRRSRT